MKNLTFALVFVVLISSALISAHGNETFLEAENLINEQISCSELTDDQLEAIGDYYMEQMHPGEQHEYMDEMMGGEGSESLRQVHINMASRIYCGETTYQGYGMMPMMDYGMMGYNSSSRYGYNWFLPLIFILIIVLLIILIFKQIKRR